MAFTTNIIVAYTSHNYGIGINGKLPWKLPNELKEFKLLTISPQLQTSSQIQYINAIVMGRKTWESMGRRLLPERINIIISNNDAFEFNEYDKNYDNPFIPIFSSWDKYEESLGNYLLNINKIYYNKKVFIIGQIFIIGGASIYKLALETKCIDNIYTTEIYDKSIICDTFYPIKLQENISSTYKLSNVSKFHFENNIYYRYLHYYNTISYLNKSIKIWNNTEENAYLTIMRHICDNGVIRNDRTKTGTKSSFGHQLRYNLRDTFPLTTTKSSFLRGIFEELMLYIRGYTDNSILQQKNIHIWDGNTSRDFLDKCGLQDYPEGDMGETYGFNMRHYGGTYINCKTIYSATEGYDQLSNVINLLKTDPTSRRILINLWNPETQHKAALPSCLCQYQFYVNTETNELSLQIYIRSSDYFLANNWNTCTGALFVNLLCNTTGLTHLIPGDLVVITGDTHIYLNHLKQVDDNLSRQPYPYPKLIIKKQKAITEFEWIDIELLGYKSHPKIIAEMAV